MGLVRQNGECISRLRVSAADQLRQAIVVGIVEIVG